MVINIEQHKLEELTDEVNETVLNMPSGMLGFAEYKQFVLVEGEKYAPFKRLQSVDNPQLGFVVIDPMEFFPDYDIELSDHETGQLGLEDATDAKIVSTVTFDRKEGWMTTNLLGPIVINTKLRVAKQIVLEDERYGTKHLIGNHSYFEDSKDQRQAV